MIQRHPEPELMDDVPEVEAYGNADFSEVNQAFVERLLNLAGQHHAVRALDLGTGPGDIPIRLVLARPKWHIVAVDASEPMLHLAREASKRNKVYTPIQWLKVDAKDTKLPPHSFDVLLSNTLLHHINNVTKFWAEVKHLARPGATILFRDLSRPVDDEAIRNIVERYAGQESSLLQEEYRRSLAASYTPDEVRSQLEEAGLNMLEVTMVTDRHLDIFGNMR